MGCVPPIICLEAVEQDKDDEINCRDFDKHTINFTDADGGRRMQQRLLGQ